MCVFCAVVPVLVTVYNARAYFDYSPIYYPVCIERQATDLKRPAQRRRSGYPEQDSVERPSEPRGVFTGRTSCCTADRELAEWFNRYCYSEQLLYS